MKKLILATLLLPFASYCYATEYTSDATPTAAEIQTLVDSAVDGDIITILADNSPYTWTSNVVVTGKGITIQAETTRGVTLITNTGTTSGGYGLFELTKDATHNIYLKGFVFEEGGTASDNESETSFVEIKGAWGDPIVVVSNCDFESNGGTGATSWSQRSIHIRTNGALIENCNFTEPTGSDTIGGMRFTTGTTSMGWAADSTMGVEGDPNGVYNNYVEDCTFEYMANGCMDHDDNARGVVRNCTFTNAAITTHGADTSTHGGRHIEWYDNDFIFDSGNNPNSAQNYWMILRGGTGVITDNDLDDIPFKSSEIHLQIQNLGRNAGPYACWNSGWPCPHQVGQGYAGGTETEEPLYVYSNTGTANLTPSVRGYGPDAACVPADAAADYIQNQDDYTAGHGTSPDFYDDGTAKPSWTKYTYPHPLSSAAVAATSTLKRVTGAAKGLLQ